MTASAASAEPFRLEMKFRQFVALIACLMAVNALAIDSMLPALPAIARSIGITTANHQQWIITAYLLGFGAAQIVYGTLADRYGRKPVLLFGLGLYCVMSLVAAFSSSLEMLLVARVVQGIGAAATRVLAVTIVRDCYSGREMARVMSLSFIVFLAVPILAPSLGQAIMLVAPWPSIFVALAGFAGVIALIALLRLPETLREEDVTRISVKSVFAAYRVTLTNRQAVGYMLATTLMMGCLFGFLNSAQQVFVGLFGAERMFTVIFALIAVFMAMSSFLNSRIVGALGTRRVSHLALIGFLGCAVMHAVLALRDAETLLTFSVLQAGMMFCFGLLGANFGALAMAPLGHVAGTASSVQGFVTTVGGALLGFFLGQQFNGTIVPLTLGFAGYGSLALLVVLVTEKGRLMRRSGPVLVSELPRTEPRAPGPVRAVASGAAAAATLPRSRTRTGSR